MSHAGWRGAGVEVLAIADRIRAEADVASRAAQHARLYRLAAELEAQVVPLLGALDAES